MAILNRNRLYLVAVRHLPDLTLGDFEKSFEKTKAWLYCRLAGRSVAMTVEGLHELFGLSTSRIGRSWTSC